MSHTSGMRTLVWTAFIIILLAGALLTGAGRSEPAGYPPLDQCSQVACP